MACLNFSRQGEDVAKRSVEALQDVGGFAVVVVCAEGSVTFAVAWVCVNVLFLEHFLNCVGVGWAEAAVGFCDELFLLV